MNLKIISAGAGSGKTYSLTKEMAKLLSPKGQEPAEVRASGIIATTFTNKAAAELKERVRIELLEAGLTREADELGNAMIGTVHSIGVQLLKRFAFEAGVSPEVDIMADSDQQVMFNQSLSTVLSMELVQEMELLSEQLGFNKSVYSSKDWRQDLKDLTDIARSNNFDATILQESKAYSLKTFFELLPEPSKKSGEALNAELLGLLDSTLLALENNDDSTKGKETLMGSLKSTKNTLKNRGHLPWYEWAKIAKTSAPKNSRDDVFDLVEFAQKHDNHPDFHEQIKRYINHIFDTAIAALDEYEEYKKVRGLIDYIDMEVLILKLLEHEMVQQVLKEEIDLLLVDEFQDTNPIQLKIFLKLTKVANKSIWVGDPKQSIYGFRGAAPDLMKAVVASTQNIDNLPMSWRSRQDLVYLCNGLFVKAFDGEISPERVVLDIPKQFKKEQESSELKLATHHWHFPFEGNRPPKSPWFEQCIARKISEVLKEGWKVRVKGSNEVRTIQAGDIAVLCRSNYASQTMAEALHKEGLKASISRAGLLKTAEASLVLACLRYVLNKHDALAIAEILLLAKQHNIEDVIEDRLAYLESVRNKAEDEHLLRWGHDNDYIQLLRSIRHRSKELSATEILNSIIEKLDIRRTIVLWGNEQQRLDNIDALRKLASDYEETCNRLHSAATLGGFLLWLEDLASKGMDEQGTGAGASAINVMTYHKSKGLEWPFVVCLSLDNDLRDSLWGLRIVRQVEEIDLEDPLANRLICYWINPYGDQEKGTALMERVEGHEAKFKSQKEALAEEVRLLYVGLTRPRDYLILPTLPKKETKWLNRVFHNGNENGISLDINSNVLLWTWGDLEIPLQTEIIHNELIMPTVEREENLVNYLVARQGEKQYESVVVENAQSLFPSLDFNFSKSHNYNKGIDVVVDNRDVGAVFKTFILADDVNKTKESRLSNAQNLLEQHELEEHFSVNQLAAFSEAFYNNLNKQFSIAQIERYPNFKYPVDKNRFFKGGIDLLLITTDNKLVLIQTLSQETNKLSNSNKSKYKEDVCLLEAASRTFKAKYQVKEVQLYIIQYLEGTLTEVEIKTAAKQTSLF